MTMVLPMAISNSMMTVPEDMDMDMDMGNMGGQQSNGGNNGQQNAADDADGLVIQIRNMALQGLELLAKRY